jgi:hypothetical protein
MLTPGLAYIATFEIEVGRPLDAGAGRRMVPVVGGKVRGPRLNGTILAGGADWQQEAAADRLTIGGRWILETDDRVRVEVETPGIRQAPAHVLSELTAGVEVDPATYYFRVAPRFIVTDAAAYAWLQRTVFVGAGAKRRDAVEIDVFAVT